MKQYIIDRVIEIADYIIDTQCTVRQAGKVFAQSKSTVHKDMQQRLADVDSSRHRQVSAILEQHLLERHIRGGLATHNKYKGN